ncbi:Zinc-finger homeodomain protein 5 [Linum perenne]
MEVRGQEINDVRMSGGSGAAAAAGGGGRRDGNHNGTTTNFLTYTTQQQQTLDHHHRSGGNGGGGGSNSSSKLSPAAVRYRECLRNHAASVGGNVYDGCGEFMPGGEEGSLEALKCAACDCHRNFHRKEIDGETVIPSPVASHHIFSPGSRRSGSGGHLVHALQLPPALPSPVMHHHHHPHAHHHHHPHHQRYLHSSSPPAAVQPMSVAFGGGGGSAATCGTESSSEDLNAFPNSSDMGMGSGMGISPHPPQYVMSKKRFRTKFTAEQKDRMMEFAEKVGWRINKQDEEAVERFCTEVGVRRQVFKVWMHNNKSVRKQASEDQHLNHHHQMRAEDGASVVGDNGQQQRVEGML